MLGKRKLYGIVGLNGDGWFHPEEHDLIPESGELMWRGYNCTYDVIDDRLFLTNLYIESSNYKEPFGVQPVTNSLIMEYDNLRRPIYFTGEISISLQHHFLFRFPYGHECTWLMAFDNGRLTEVVDFRQDNEQTRQRYESTPWASYDQAIYYGTPPRS